MICAVLYYYQDTVQQKQQQQMPQWTAPPYNMTTYTLSHQAPPADLLDFTGVTQGTLNTT